VADLFQPPTSVERTLKVNDVSPLEAGLQWSEILTPPPAISNNVANDHEEKCFRMTNIDVSPECDESAQKRILNNIVIVKRGSCSKTSDSHQLPCELRRQYGFSLSR
jgi:hypothetical protein